MSNVVSQFYGMVVLMPYRENRSARPYFEVMYEGEVSKFEIEDGRMYEGHLAQEGQEIVKDWLLEHGRELNENWKCLQNNEPIKPIAPIL